VIKVRPFRVCSNAFLVGKFCAVFMNQKEARIVTTDLRYAKRIIDEPINTRFRDNVFITERINYIFNTGWYVRFLSRTTFRTWLSFYAVIDVYGFIFNEMTLWGLWGKISCTAIGLI
jgi:hypothetical protein